MVFTHSTVASVVFDGVWYSPLGVTVTGYGDNSNRVSVGLGAYSIPLDTAQVTLEGIGTYSFISPLKEFFSNSSTIDVFDGLPVVGLTNAVEQGWVPMI